MNQIGVSRARLKDSAGQICALGPYVVHAWKYYAFFFKYLIFALWDPVKFWATLQYDIDKNSQW